MTDDYRSLSTYGFAVCISRSKPIHSIHPRPSAMINQSSLSTELTSFNGIARHVNTQDAPGLSPSTHQEPLNSARCLSVKTLAPCSRATQWGIPLSQVQLEFLPCNIRFSLPEYQIEIYQALTSDALPEF